MMKSTSDARRVILSTGLSSGIPSSEPAAPVVLTVPITVYPVEAVPAISKPTTLASML